MEEKGTGCWCSTVDVSVPIPMQYDDCLCPKCLTLFSGSETPKLSDSDLVEGKNFYYQQGRIVLLKS
jgi:hypothetical protein